MLFRIAILVLSTFSISSTALGQSPDASHSAAKIKAVHELLHVMRVGDTYGQTVVAIVDSIIGRLPPKARDRQKLIEFFTKHVGWAALKDDFVRIYAETYTEQDVKNLIQFYKTPTGRKTIEAMPALTKKGMEIGQAKVQAALPKLKEALGLK